MQQPDTARQLKAVEVNMQVSGINSARALREFNEPDGPGDEDDDDSEDDDEDADSA